MNKFEVIWTKNAQLDLESIIEYIKIDSITIAKKIFFEIKKSVKIYTISTKEKELCLSYNKLVFQNIEKSSMKNIESFLKSTIQKFMFY